MGTLMKRSERLEMVKKVVDDFERRKAEALAAAERRVSENEKKLADLEAYRDGYVRDFAVRVVHRRRGAACGVDELGDLTRPGLMHAFVNFDKPIVVAVQLT